MASDAKTLDTATEKYRQFAQGLQNVEILQGFDWAPVVEVKHPEAFLADKMYGMLEAGNVVKVPLMMGFTSEESNIFNADAGGLLRNMQEFDQHLDWLVPNDMAISDQSECIEMGRKIRDIYTGGEPLADHLGDGVRYSSDTSFTRSIIKHAELYSDCAKTYFYIFSYDGQIGNVNINYDGVEKVGHSEELAYLFCGGGGCDGNGFPEADRVTRRRLVKLWTDFAKTRNPTPAAADLLQNVTWPAVDTSDGDFHYLDINEKLTIKNHPKNETYEAWTDLYDSLGCVDFDTY